MRTQYLAQIQNGYCKEDEWWNPKTMLSTEGRYCKTLEEAKEWIDKAIEHGKKLATEYSYIGTPPFSIESPPDNKNLVTATRIRKRQVSEWEDC